MISNYELYNPTRLIYGENRIEELELFLPKNSNILLLYGKGSIKRNGVYDKVVKSLRGFTFEEFGGIEPNPSFETLMKAIKIGREKRIDFILAVGGGSVIDGAKFVAAAIPFNGDEWTILSEQAEIESSIPLGTVLTLPATGSEMNRAAVISRIKSKDKRAFINEKSFPEFSILDTSVLKSLPKRQTANGIVDAFVHTTEQYITYPVNAQLQDRIAESILITLIEEGPKFYKDSSNLEAGGNIMFSATMALNGVLSTGVPTDWSIHMIGHELTAHYNIDHARTLAIVLPALYTVKMDNKLDKLVQYAERVWNIKSGSKQEKATEAINKTVEFFNSLGISTKLSDYKVDLEFIITEIQKRFEKRGITQLGENGIIDLNDIETILKMSWD